MNNQGLKIDLTNIPSLEARHEKFYKYLKHSLLILPESVLSLDSSKVLLAYFSVLSLELFNKLDKLPHSKDSLINWIYKHQLENGNDKTDPNLGIFGFRGSASLITEKNKSIQNHIYDCSHITMTFAALNTLLTLDDDLSRVNIKSITQSLKKLQLEDGSYKATFDGSENDIRFLYSACCICYVLNDWSGMNIDMAVNFILSCLTYEGAFSQNPDVEAHGGSTYCAVSSLYLMNRMNALSEKQLEKLTRWCMNRQNTGFNGRVNKPWDTCYSFWIGATLKILDALKYTNYAENIGYIYETFNPITGGFAKWPDCTPDPLHTFTGLCGLSLVEYPTLKPIHPALTISMTAYERLKSLHAKWKQTESTITS